MSAATQTLDTVQSRHPVRLQVGLGDRHRDGPRAQGAERGHHPADLGAQGGARLAAGMAAEGVRRLAADDRAALGARRACADRLPGPALLRRAEEEAGAEEPGRGRSGAAEDLREARHPAEGAGDPGRRRSGVRRGRQPGRGGRGVRQRLGGDHVPRDAAEGGRDLLPDLRGGARPSGAGAAVSRLRRAGVGQFLRRAEFARCSPTAASSTCRRACAARWSCPPISASMRAAPASSSAR